MVFSFVSQQPKYVLSRRCYEDFFEKGASDKGKEKNTNKTKTYLKQENELEELIFSKKSNNG